jgi:tetratricopeptide (TPR) repeat protein
MKYSAFVLAIAFFLSLPVLADEDHHHEDLTPDQLGTVHFPVSCSPSAQKTFERGVALLHSFWYEEAEKDFVQVAQDDPQCAMAQWGLAMSQWHQLWNHPDIATLKKGEAEIKKGKSLHPRTGRERDYLTALGDFYSSPDKRDYQARADAYSHAMEGVYQRYPDDREAAIYYSLSLLASEPDGDTTFANRKKAAAILEKLFAVVPDHPGVAHYLIHSYDKPQLAQLGLPAARRYAQIAPAAPHALHMPSHIFARLGLWQDDINSNLASIAATQKTAAMHMGGEGHQFHAMDFLVYAYLQSGHEADAQHVIDEVKAMPPMKDMYGLGFDPHISALVSLPAKYDLELHHWTDAAALVPVPGADTGDNAITYWARAIGAARSGNLDQAKKDLSEIDAIHRTLVANKKGFAEAVEQDYQEAAAWIAHAEGRNEEAMKALRTIAEREEATGDEPLAIPAREMVADLLLDMNRPAQALLEFQADLKFNPNRFDGLYGAAYAAELAGKNDQANTYYAELVKSCDGSNSDRPELGRARAQLAKKGAETASASGK